MDLERISVSPDQVRAWLENLDDAAKDRLLAGEGPLASCPGCAKREACDPFITALRGVLVHGEAWFDTLNGVSWAVADEQAHISW